MRRVTEQDIIQINEAYLTCGTYTGAAKATGWSTSTVKKYVISGYTSKQKVRHEEIQIPSVEETINRLTSMSFLSCITKEETEDLKSLWEDMIV